MKLSNAVGNVVGPLFNHSYSKIRFQTQVPQLFFEYQYALSGVFKISGQIGYSKFTKNLIYESPGNADLVDSMIYSYLLVMPGIEVRYNQKGNTTFYGHYMVGLASVSETDGPYQEQRMGPSFSAKSYRHLLWEKTGIFRGVGVWVFHIYCRIEV